MLRRWVSSLQELDRLAAEVAQAPALYEHTRTGQGADAFRLRYERAVAEFNARKPLIRLHFFVACRELQGMVRKAAISFHRHHNPPMQHGIPCVIRGDMRGGPHKQKPGPQVRVS